MNADSFLILADGTIFNGTSFGGQLSNDKLVDSLRVLGIPYCTVEKDADLSTVLSTAASFQQVSP